MPTNISKAAPDFCTVYVISKGKVQSVRNAVRAAPTVSPLRAQIQNQTGLKSASESPRRSISTPRGLNLTLLDPLIFFNFRHSYLNLRR